MKEESFDEIIEKICMKKLQQAEKIGVHTRSLLIATQQQDVENILEQREKAVRALLEFDSKIAAGLKEKGVTLEYPEKFRKKFNGIILSILHNNEQIHQRLKKQRDELAKSLALPSRNRAAARYMTAP